MPRRIDARVSERCTRPVGDQLTEYPSLTAACWTVARREGVGCESARRLVRQAEADSGERPGPSSEKAAEIKGLKAKVRRLEEDNEIVRRAAILFSGELDCRSR